VFPSIVSTGDDGMKSVSYDKLVAPLVEAVKQLKNMFDTDHNAIAKLKADNDALRAGLSAYKAANDNEAAQIKALTARLDALEAARH
jgi:capsule polysaccharide export protein KpsE/RkpR